MVKNLTKKYKTKNIRVMSSMKFDNMTEIFAYIRKLRIEFHCEWFASNQIEWTKNCIHVVIRQHKWDCCLWKINKSICILCAIIINQRVWVKHQKKNVKRTKVFVWKRRAVSKYSKALNSIHFAYQSTDLQQQCLAMAICRRSMLSYHMVNQAGWKKRLCFQKRFMEKCDERKWRRSDKNCMNNILVIWSTTKASICFGWISKTKLAKVTSKFIIRMYLMAHRFYNDILADRRESHNRNKTK